MLLFFYWMKAMHGLQVFNSKVTVSLESPLFRRVRIIASEQASPGSGELEYTLSSSIQFYSNYLDWFYQTFSTTEGELRDALFTELPLRAGMRVLLTGVGLGQELFYLLELVGAHKLSDVEIYAQDFSPLFVDYIASQLIEYPGLESHQQLNTNVYLFHGDAVTLPLHDGHFDYCHHFGGINRFSSTQKAVSEMARVLKVDESSRVMFSDESVAPWLRTTELGKMVIENNALYGACAPLDILPPTASGVKIEWICQNCFYKISFGTTFSPACIDPRVRHKSPRGGSMYSRYYGKLEGVDPDLKKRLNSYATSSGTPISDLLSECITTYLDRYSA